MRTLPPSVYHQPNATSGPTQVDRGFDTLTDTLPAVATHLDGARAALLTVTAECRRRGIEAGDS